MFKALTIRVFDEPTEEEKKVAADALSEEERKKAETRTFTQDELNKILAEDRRKHKAQTEKHIEELEKLKKSKNLSDTERASLQARIEEQQNLILTKEQMLEKEKHKLQHEHQTSLQQERTEKDTWKGRYFDSTIVRAIMDSSIENEAYSPEQIVALIKTDTRLVEDTDQEGNGLGTFSPRVKFKDTDSEGKPTTLDLSVSEAIKRMKDLPERYGNLFKSGVNAGLGGTGSVQGGGKLNASQIRSMEDYRKNRGRLVGRKG